MGLFDNFPYTNFHEINLDQIIKIMRQMQDEWQQVENDWDSMQDFINNYFENLDVSEEVLQALQTMAGDGELNTIIDPVIITETASWLSEHITPTTPAVDNTLSIAGAAADAKATGDAVADLKEDIDEITYINSNTISTKQPQDWNSGIWLNKSATPNSSYAYSQEINVTEGDIVTVQDSNVTTSYGMRFIEVYDINGDIIYTQSTEVTAYTVPSGAASLRITTYSASVALKFVFVTRTTRSRRPKKYEANYKVSAESNNLIPNSAMQIPGKFDNKKNCAYSFYGEFTDFGALEIGHGKTEYGSVYLVIDDTNITVYAYNGVAFAQYPHGLSMSNFIAVLITVADTDTARADIIVMTDGGIFSQSNVVFFGSNGSIYAKSTNTMASVRFVYTIADLVKTVYIFGDSYIALADNTKWPYYAINNGYNDMLLSGFGGATAQDEIVSFRNIMNLNNPKFLCWFLGMNNPDSGSVNANWLSATEEVAEYCDDNDITLILATIPNTPTVNNTYKNNWVKSSGYRYVDFADAVGAESAGSSWYTGMLSQDNTHPTTEGAKALWLRMVCDCPEIINKSR